MSVSDVNIDWDSFEHNWNNKTIAQYLGSLSYTPQYVQIAQVNKPKRTTGTFQSNSEPKKSFLNYLQSYFSNDKWTISKYKKDSLIRATIRSKTKAKSSPVLFENDEVEDNIQEDGTSLLIEYSKKKKSLVQLLNNKSILTNFRMSKPEPIDLSVKSYPLNEQSGFEFNVLLKELKFGLGDIEPFFGTIALYDIVTKNKVTEDFHFILNTNTVNNMINLKTDDPITKSSNALFILDPSFKTPNVHMIVTIRKVLKGDLEDVWDGYIKGKDIKEKDLKKLIDETNLYLKALKKYTQHFAWASLPMFSNDGKLLHNGPVAIDNFIRAKHDLSSFIDDLKKEKKGKKEIVGHLKMVINTDIQDTNRIDTSMSPVLPVDENDKSRYIEVHGFPNPQSFTIPAIYYVNNLYFYPEKLSIDSLSSGTSGRNICIEVKLMDQDNNPSAPGLPNIYGMHGSKEMKTQEMTSLWYHSKKPKYCDEFKIKLPFNLTDKHHLLLTFYHINCKPHKTSKSDPQAPIGYAVIPLKRDDMLLSINTTYIANVQSKLPDSYLSKILSGEEIEEKAKNILQYRINLNSTVYPSDEYISKFLKYSSEPESDQGLTLVSIQELEKANTNEVIRFMPVVFHQLIQLIAHSNVQLSNVAFETFVFLIDRIIQHDTKHGASFIKAYIEDIFDSNSNKNNELFDILTEVWTRYNKSQLDKKKLAINVSWVIFSLIFKSLLLNNHEKNILNDDSERIQRLPKESKLTLLDLINSFAKEINYYIASSKSLRTVKLFTCYLANFLMDLSDVIDRGFVFKLYSTYMSHFNTLNIDVVGMKCVMIKVMSQHPNFYQLNFPVQPDFKTYHEMIRNFKSRHFLIGSFITLIEQTFSSIGSGGNEQIKIRNISIDTLCELFYNIDASERWSATIDKINIACMFWPFVSIIIDKWDLILTLQRTEREKILICFMWLLKNVPRRFLEYYWERETERRVSILFEIIRKGLEEFEFKGRKEVATKRPNVLSNNSFFDIAKLVSKKSLDSITIEANTEKVDKKKKSKKKVQSVINTSTNETSNVENKTPKAIDPNVLIDREADLSCAISSAVLDAILIFLRKFTDALKRNDIFVMLWNPLIDLMKYNQSLEFINALFESIYFLLPECSSLLFKKSNSVCSDLMYQTLRKCNSHNREVRQHAVTFFVELLKINYKEVNNVNRSRLQSTIAIIKIVGQSETNNFSNLTNTLSTAAKEVRSKPMGDIIADIIVEIEKKAHDIINDNNKLKKYQYDPEMISDLQYTMSLHLEDSPDERLSWLENLSKHHLINKNFEESAQTKIVMAGLVLNYLKLLKRWETKMVPAFHHVCPNIDNDIKLHERLTSLRLLGNEICQTSMFTKEGFVRLLKDAIQLLTDGEFYESSVAAYRMMLPVFYENDDYAKQKECYDHLSNLCQKILDVNVMQQRLFSNYYRVAFYGPLVGPEMDGVEYIYKESPMVRVSDMTEKMKSQYGRKFGEENIVLIPNNTTVEAFGKLDPKKVYMQICSVELYLSPEQLEEKNTGFKQHFGARKFLMEQPFTKAGKAQGNLEDQYIRRTIFTTERQFPFLKKRLVIVNKEEEELEPIQYALSLIEKRTRSLRTELNLSPPNIKNLQRELQGSLLAQVNAGPIAVIEGFLADEKEKLYPQEKRIELATMVSEFERTLAFALKLNKNSLDGSENQLILQSELEKGYNKLKSSLANLKIYESILNLKKKQEDDEKKQLLINQSKTIMEKKEEKPIKPLKQSQLKQSKNTTDQEVSKSKENPKTKEVESKKDSSQSKSKRMSVSKSQKTVFDKQKIIEVREKFSTGVPKLKASQQSDTSDSPLSPLSPSTQEERDKLREERLRRKEAELRSSSKEQEISRVRNASIRRGSDVSITLPNLNTSNTNNDNLRKSSVTETKISTEQKKTTEETPRTDDQSTQKVKATLVKLSQDVIDSLKTSLERVPIALEEEELRHLIVSLKALKSLISSLKPHLEYVDPPIIKPEQNENRLEFVKNVVITEVENNVNHLKNISKSIEQSYDTGVLKEVAKIMINIRKVVNDM